jgi:hypothetical protein
MDARQLMGAFVMATAIAGASTIATAEKQFETQTPPPTQPMPKPARPTGLPAGVTAAPTPAEVTVMGCLYRAADVMVTQPDGRSGAAHDKGFVLTNATLESTGREPASGAMYKVDKIEENRLTPHVGKRVELVGQIEADATDLHVASNGVGSTAGRSDPRRAKIPEFDAISIHQVEGACPARPTTKTVRR